MHALYAHTIHTTEVLHTKCWSSVRLAIKTDLLSKTYNHFKGNGPPSFLHLDHDALSNMIRLPINKQQRA